MHARSISLLLCLLLTACDGGGGGAGSTDAGPMASGDGSTTSADGGGGSGADAGSSSAACPATPTEVPIRFGSCGTLDACGGDPRGVWVYDDVCIEDPTPDLTDICATARVEDLSGTAQGCVELDGSVVSRDVSGTTHGTIVIPASCTFGLGCATVQAALAMALPGTTCTESAGDCRCPFTQSWATSDDDTYTITGSVLTTSGGTSYDFCASGGTLRYQERGDRVAEPGIAQLN